MYLRIQELQFLQLKLDSSGFISLNEDAQYVMPKSYALVPKTILSDKSMTSSDVRVFTVLLDLRSSANDIDDGLDEIAKQTGLSKRTVSESLARLEHRGFIIKTLRGPNTGLITLTEAIA